MSCKAEAGYLMSSQGKPGRTYLEPYDDWCTRHALPRVIVSKATYWSVAVEAERMPGGRFGERDLAYLEDLAWTCLLRSPSAHPRVKVLPRRVVAYGCTREDARRMAAAIVRRYPPLGQYRDPYQYPPRSSQATAPPPPAVEHPRGSLLDRVRGGAASKIVYLDMERARRRDVFGLPIRRPSPPDDRGPA